MSKTKTDIDDATIRIEVKENVKIFLEDSYQVRVITARVLVDKKK